MCYFSKKKAVKKGRVLVGYVTQAFKDGQLMSSFQQVKSGGSTQDINDLYTSQSRMLEMTWTLICRYDLILPHKCDNMWMSYASIILRLHMV